MHENRLRLLKEAPERGGPVVYWMSRDQRVRDNWALLHAQERAVMKKESLAVVFCLVPTFLRATIRQYGFMLKGLQQVETDLEKKNIGFFLLTGRPEDEVPKFIRKHGASLLVTDFDPLRIKQAWKKAIAENINIPFHEVDAHNIVPCWLASPKQEYAGYTFRPKIKRAVPEFLCELPPLKKHPVAWRGKMTKTNWSKAIKSLEVDRAVPEVDWTTPGEKAAHRALRDFVKNRLAHYERSRNDPTRNGQSNLSPYLHFGQLSAQRVALEVQNSSAAKKVKDTFLEELIVRRELSDNFCFYNADYDSTACFPDWARKSLADHQNDRRTYTYSREQLETAKTRDELWNAAQNEMVKTGKMHGYMRMYWAKKILEWTPSPEEVLKIAIYLNDKYELDGRDPNGYAGVAWSIGGVHDRPWFERPIFGKVRYMSYGGCKSKFDVKAYISKVDNQ
jgi:deoxyribodipyrimidine photo-lyase